MNEPERPPEPEPPEREDPWAAARREHEAEDRAIVLARAAEYLVGDVEAALVRYRERVG